MLMLMVFVMTLILIIQTGYHQQIKKIVTLKISEMNQVHQRWESEGIWICYKFSCISLYEIIAAFK